MNEDSLLTPYQRGALKRKGKKHRKHRRRKIKTGYRKVKRNYKKRKYYFKSHSLRNRGRRARNHYDNLFENQTISYISKLYDYESEEDKWEGWIRHYIEVQCIDN